MSSGLQHALETLYGQERRRSDFRVEDTVRLLSALGQPQDRFRAIHVAGTNGKGSVCALVERALRAAGARTGLYTSPHLVDYRERIRIAGRWLDEAELEERLAHLQQLDEARDRTFFEITTALGFEAFARHGVEWAVVEVGLGGRLDATNALAPAVSAICSVGLDHTEILGPTLADVAREKAGIAKPDTPLVVGRLTPAATAAAQAVAEERGARWVAAGDRVPVLESQAGVGGVACVVDVAPWGRLRLSLPLRGAHQIENARVALAILSVLAEGGLTISAAAVRRGFLATRWPGRLEPCPGVHRLWWDGAHNPEGVARLVRAWRDDLRLTPPGAIVFAASRDKDAAAMLSALRGLAPHGLLFATQSTNERAMPAATVGDAARATGWEPRVRDDVAAGVREALAATRGRVLLAGSLFAIGDAMRSLGGAPGAQA